MVNDTLDEREFELINIIGAEIGANQRRLSRLMDLSLGMTNMLIRRLIAKGFIRIEQLNKRKVQYILTPKGFAEKMHKSVRYTLKTINSIGLIKNGVKEILLDLYARGVRDFFVFGNPDLISLVEMTFRELNKADCIVVVLKTIPQTPIAGVLLTARENLEDGNPALQNHVDLIKELAKKGHALPAVNDSDSAASLVAVES